MLILKELRLKAIGRFVEEQVIDVGSLGNFVQVDAENRNTGGSSGSGKSTIFMALDYLLGVNNRPTTVLQSRLTKETMSVSGLFDFNGKPLNITRSKSGLIIDLDGQITKGSSDLAEEKLDQIIGMPRELFRKILHKRQKEGGFFLDLTPKEIHEFLMDCLGLSEFKSKALIIEKKIADLLVSKIKAEMDVKTSKASLQATQDAILALGMAPIKDIHREVIIELKERSDRSAVRFANVTANCESEYRECEKSRPIISNGQYDATIREDLERRRKTAEAEIQSAQEKERSRQNEIKLRISEKVSQRNGSLLRFNEGTRAKADAARIANEIKSIRSQTCPTCLQNWETEAALNSEKIKLAELSKLRLIIEDSVKAEIECNKLGEELIELQAQSAPMVDVKISASEDVLVEIAEKLSEEKLKAAKFYEQQNFETKMLLDAFSIKRADLKKKHAIELDQARGQMDVDRRTLDVAVNKLKSYEETRVRYEASFTSLKSKEANFTKQIEEAEKSLLAMDNSLLLAEEAKRAIKTYMSYSFDDALEIIGDSATKLIRSIPNMSNATIQFEGTKETKDGRIKEEVNAVIGMDGEIGVPIKSLSGGERTSADLAVDLSVIDFIEDRTGKGINIMILDEPFNGLGAVEIEMVLEILKNSNVNKKIVIVDHNDLVKQMVQSRLIVVRDGLTSKVG